MSENAPGWTPYRFSFNNPINFLDNDGNFESKAEARAWARENNIRTGWFSRNKIVENNDGIFSINNKIEHTSIYNDADFGVQTAVLIMPENNKTLSQIWGDAMDVNSDANIISVGFDFAFLGGMGYQFQAVRINKGEDMGWHFYNTTNANIGLGLAASLETSAIHFNEKNRQGLPLNRLTFDGIGNNYSAGLGNVNFSYGYATDSKKGRLSMNPFINNKLYTSIGGGVSIGSNLGVMWQGSKSKLIKRK